MIIKIKIKSSVRDQQEERKRGRSSFLTGNEAISFSFRNGSSVCIVSMAFVKHGRVYWGVGGGRGVN